VAEYRLLINPSTGNEIEALDRKKDRQRIVKRIAALAPEPQPAGSEKLAGAGERYRVRQGQFRIVYAIDDAARTIEVVKEPFSTLAIGSVREPAYHLYIELRLGREMDQRVVHSDPEILGGTPVFIGTRVPVKNLFDYLEAGDSLDEFLESFPSVSREQAVAALKLAREALAPDAHPA
jgi:uncharacterized protein (DUF433 family)/mRNA-degrading endonuclease RelE of RelBE toxin-antitoxin system